MKKETRAHTVWFAKKWIADVVVCVPRFDSITNIFGQSSVGWHSRAAEGKEAGDEDRMNLRVRGFHKAAIFLLPTKIAIATVLLYRVMS